MLEPTPIIVAVIGLVASVAGVLVTWRIAARRRPIDEQTASAANAAVLSKAAAEMVEAFRADVSDLRVRIERLETRNETLETRDQLWSRYYYDLHSRWPHHRQQDAAPTIDL